MRVLIAEDERDLNDLIAKKLTSEGYSVDCVYDGQQAIDVLDYTDYDAIILDIMMPVKDGYEVLAFLRGQKKSTPVLFLTARDTIADKVKGLDSGANDYLVKPFAFAELMARVRALTRTSYGQADNILQCADLKMNLTTKQVTRGGKEIILSAKEYALLEYLMHNQGIIISRDQIENHIWNYEYEGGTNVVDVYISYLRKKIDGGQNVKLIHTIRGRGYLLKEGK